MPTREAIIEVNDVYKNFRVYFDKGSMLKEQFVNPGRSRYEEREILRGITFKVYRGETVALIGQNGCGKSTTLKMLTKILYPNKGTVTVNGKVSSLIELGAGFHPDMSGRENIYINASILGIKKEEVDKRIDEIIRFSELEEFIDNPIRTYSSGMYMRLAFSVAINVDADILLIDEILAVGDQAFQEKCIRKLDELRTSGVTVVLVSHAMGQIKEIADRCIWIENGQIREDGDTETVCDHYEEAMTRRREERDELEDEQRKEAEENATVASEDVPEVAVDDLAAQKEFRKKERERRRAEKQQKAEAFSAKWQGGGIQGKPVAGVAIIFLMVLLSVCSSIFMIGLIDISEDMIPLIEKSMVLKAFGYVFFVLGRISVPMLLIMMGFEILPRDYSSGARILEYYKKVFFPMFGTWVSLVIAYQLFLHFWDGRAFDVLSIIRQILVIEYVDLSHAWIFRFIMLFLLIAPIAAIVLQMFSVGMLRFLMIIEWVLIFLFPGLDLYGQANGGEMSFPQSLGTFCYFFYFCLGYLVSRYVQRIFKGSKEVVFFVLAFGLTVWSQILFDLKGIEYLIKPTYFGISIIALFGFDLLVRVKVDDMYPRISALFKQAYKCTRGAFYIFVPVQMLLERYVFRIWEVWNKGTLGTVVGTTIMLWVMTFVVSMLLVWVVRKLISIVVPRANS
jgi:ABC-2 type transport system ATP-binding protein